MQEGIIKTIPFETTDPVKLLQDDPYKTALIGQMIQDCAWLISNGTYLEGLAEKLIIEIEKDIIK
ncbi:MAG: hypothetical protein KAJ23_05415 [Maribacter sp.]|nr:hypothetical protein [Maribacter sp.]